MKRLLKLIACLFGRHGWTYTEDFEYRTCRWCGKAVKMEWISIREVHKKLGLTDALRQGLPPLEQQGEDE